MLLVFFFHVKMTQNTLSLTTVDFPCGFYIAGEKFRVSALCKEELGKSKGFPVAAAQPVVPQNCLCSLHLEQMQQRASRSPKPTSVAIAKCPDQIIYKDTYLALLGRIGNPRVWPWHLLNIRGRPSAVL